MYYGFQFTQGGSIFYLFLIFLLDIALLNHDEEAYDLLDSLESFMNTQIEESELISVSSFESDGQDIENATQAFLDAALTGDLKLLTSLYNSGTKVLSVHKLVIFTRLVKIYIIRDYMDMFSCNIELNDRLEEIQTLEQMRC